MKVGDDAVLPMGLRCTRVETTERHEQCLRSPEGLFVSHLGVQRGRRAMVEVAEDRLDHLGDRPLGSDLQEVTN
ncbi:hypothetical protein, partial [Bosea sp. (in: a-proteobacteria)]|uniref:hypothetical protein n=1 Tax=Bosea sp. (in: a-proteobacteria) TaxID=1871050 RepID=UPI0031FE69A2